jgi:hypothetical protein
MKIKFLLSVIVALFISMGVQAFEVVGPFGGTGDITVANGYKIAVYTQGTAKVYYKAAYPPTARWTLATTLTNGTYKSSASSGTTLYKIEADVQGAKYVVDTNPFIDIAYGLMKIYQGSVTADTTNDTLTVFEMLGGIVTMDSTGDVDLTLPTGTAMDASYDGFNVGDAFDWYVINIGDTSDDVVDLTAATGHTIIGETTVNAPVSDSDGNGGPSAGWRTRKSAANTFETYRIH